MSDFRRPNDETWDGFFDLILSSEENPTRTEAQAELARRGIDVSKVIANVQEAARAARLRAESEPVKAAPLFQHGDPVRIKSQRDRVGTVIGSPRRIAAENWYSVQFGSEQRQIPESSLERHRGGIDPFSLVREGSLGSKKTLSKCVTFTKLKHPLRNTLYSFRSTRTQFYSYQFKPLVKFLDSPAQRILIADEVGLGKTIEAGFVLRELDARQDLRRVLIVCPSRLCRKWKDELARRFDEEFRILDSAGLREFLADVEEKEDRTRIRGICSLQAIRGRQLLDAFEAVAPSLDLVIVDEAHHMRNRDTLSNRAGRVLSQCADAMLLLTATPIHLGNENLFNLLSILDPDEFDRYEAFEQLLTTNEVILGAERTLRREADLQRCKAELRNVEGSTQRNRFLRNPVYRDVLEKLDRYDPSRRDQLVDIQQDLARLNVLSHILTRTRKREVDINRPQRTAQVVPVEFGLDEREFYEQATDMCIDWYSRMSGDWAARFAVITLQRQMASSIPAFLDRYHGGDGASVSDESQSELSDLDLEDWSESANGNGADTNGPRLRDNREFRNLVRSYRHLVERDSKYDSLVATLRDLDRVEPGRKLIVFSYFKGTLYYLDQRLRKDGYSCLLLTGDVPSNPADPDEDERGRRMRQFREDPQVRILLSSEVGSEGLDFQFCHILVNYDLPWNPMVVEQRIGRLDRLGQTRERIIICNLSVKGTIEDRILDRLYNRIRIFEESIGDLEPILGDEIRRLTDELLGGKLTAFEQERLIEERAEVLERKRFESERLEQESSRFLGHDEFFNEEIGRVQSLRRYLSADELRVFVADFLETEFPRCALQPARQAGCFWLTVTSEFEAFVRQYSAPSDPGLIDLLARMHRGGFLLAFDAEAAYEYSDADLFHSQHPIARAVKGFYEEHVDRVHPAAKICVSCNNVPKADYFYVLSLLEVSGARPGRYLEAVFVPVDLESTLSPDISEELLSEMIVNGETLEEEFELPPDMLDALRAAADEELGRRLVERRTELERVNEALVETRLASLTASFEVKHQKNQELLQRAENRQQKERYIRMLRGGLRNMEADFERKRRLLEEARLLDLQLHTFAAGIVRID